MTRAVRKVAVKATRVNKTGTKKPAPSRKPAPAAKKANGKARPAAAKPGSRAAAAVKKLRPTSAPRVGAGGEPFGAQRLATVRNLIEAERRHDLPGILACFGPEPTLEFVGGPRHAGAERVGQIYGDLLRAFPDLAIETMAEHVGEHSVIVELVLHGTHRQQWLGMAPRGRTLTLPACSIFLFDRRDQLQSQRLYLDRNLAIVQLTSGLLR
jgi:SnoaL-like polyketide cyclase